MKKKLGLCLLLVLSLLVVSGCSLSKKSLTAAEFTKIAEDNNLITESVKESQFNEYDVIRDAIVAINTEGWQIEFYELSDDEQSKSMYSKNQAEFDKDKGTTTQVEVGNYTKYTNKTKTKYMVLSRVDNTLLYVNVDSNFKDAVDKIIETLGY